MKNHSSFNTLKRKLKNKSIHNNQQIKKIKLKHKLKKKWKKQKIEIM